MSVTQPLVADRYRLMRPLGEGGMGRVWLARDEALGREVAVKEVVPPLGLTPAEKAETGRRTLREARATARLNHPNVVRVYDVVQTDKHPWIVMEYVPSRSLQQVITEEGPLPPQRVAVIGLAVLGALTAAHRAGVLHRDVKPSNVLLTDDGRVVLTDFGLATIADEAAVTRPGIILGSPAYIAPERARDGRSGPESDLWSLGATLYAALEGQSPFARSNAIATLTALATEEPPRSARAGPLRPLLDGLLRKVPHRRIGVAEAERLLRYAAGGLGGRVRMVPKPRQSPSDRVRNAPAASAPPATDTRPSGAAAPAPTQPQAPSPAPATAPAPAPLPTSAPSGPTPTARLPEVDLATDAGSAARGPRRPAFRPAALWLVILGLAAHWPATFRPGALRRRLGSGAAALRDRLGPGAAALRDRFGTAGTALRVRLGTGGTLVRGRAGAGAVRRRLGDGGTAARERLRSVDYRRLARSFGRRRMMIAAGAAAVLLIAAVAVVIERGAAPATRRGVSAGVQPNPPTTAAAPAPSTPSPSPVPSSSSPTSPSSTAPALPDGWQMYRDPTGFSMAAPVGWNVSREGTMVYFRDPRGSGVLGVDQTDRPQPDPVGDWTRQERVRIGGGDFPRYRRIRIESVDYFRVCADWEFTYNVGSVRTHAINRGFVTSDRQAYGIWWSTADAEWADRYRYFELVTSTFRPKP